jgi:hypothetical protein
MATYNSDTLQQSRASHWSRFALASGSAKFAGG